MHGSVVGAPRQQPYAGGRQLDRHGAVLVGAQHVAGVELAEHRGVGVPVVVVAPHGYNGDDGVDRLEETGRVRVAAMVGDLQDRRPQQVGALQQRGLGRGAGVTGQQQHTVAVADPEHQRALVALQRRPLRAGTEHLHQGGAQPEGGAGHDGADRHPPLPGGQVGLARGR